MASVQPDHGGRIELRLESNDELEVVYRAELATPDGVAIGQVRVAVADGGIAFELDAEPAEWLVGVARGVLRSLWRSHAEAGWPRRVTRWRAGPG
jgi:hypothetical protein